MSFKWFKMPHCIPPTKYTKTKRNHEMVKNISIDKMKQNSVMFPLPFPPSSSFLAQQCERRPQISLQKGFTVISSHFSESGLWIHHLGVTGAPAWGWWEMRHSTRQRDQLLHGCTYDIPKVAGQPSRDLPSDYWQEKVGALILWGLPGIGALQFLSKSNLKFGQYLPWSELSISWLNENNHFSLSLPLSAEDCRPCLLATDILPPYCGTVHKW